MNDKDREHLIQNICAGLKQARRDVKEIEFLIYL